MGSKSSKAPRYDRSWNGPLPDSNVTPEVDTGPDLLWSDEEPSENIRNLTSNINANSNVAVRASSDANAHTWRPRCRCLADIEPAPLEWLWDGVIPRGSLTLITGETGVGKSPFMIEVAAAVTHGRTGPLRMRPRQPVVAAAGKSVADDGSSSSGDRLSNGVDGRLASPAAESAGDREECFSEETPDGWNSGMRRVSDGVQRAAGASDRSSIVQRANNSATGNPSLHADKGSVLLFSAGDPLTKITIPRLIAAGADRTKLFDMSDEAATDANRIENISADPRADGKWRFQLPRDLTVLESELRRMKSEGKEIRMIVLDPIDQYWNSRAKEQDCIDTITRLTELAETFNVAVVALSSSIPARITTTGLKPGTVGNKALVNAARSVWMMAQDLEHDDRRLLIPVKTSFCERQLGKAMFVQGGVIEWDADPVKLTSDEYLVQSKEKIRNPLIREELSEINRATNWLREKLNNGPVPSAGLRHDAGMNEIAYSTLRRAFTRLGCKSVKDWLVDRWAWVWRLPGLQPY